ncbi:hypothetical protein FA15DRAFT_703120 [Coprinopsis marcescibilis]|uniref:Uncharacterized protein n=1 Tax=Coprinopsis marcescibilis TaxID=230819 RepID=A0A5C3KZQ1_COPMA|nr:hypothetical protein FA15DRAFT_703120 [Coprinopsis marcescibilis]
MAANPYGSEYSNSEYTVYPTTGTLDYQHATYTGHYGYNGGYGNFGGNSNSNNNNVFGDGNPSANIPAQRGASYFFGFLITFIVLLLVFVCCVITTRRRYVARQRTRRLQAFGAQSESRPNRFVPFGGLLGLRQNWEFAQERELAGYDDVRKEKPTYHEVQLVELESGKGGAAWAGKGNGTQTEFELGPKADTWFSPKGSHARTPSNWSWRSIEPLSASIVRPPKDLQPYEHFENLSPPRNDFEELPVELGSQPYWPRNPHSGYMMSSRAAESPVRTTWYSTWRSFWTNNRSRSATGVSSYPLSSMLSSSTGTGTPAGRSSMTLRDSSTDVNSGSSHSSSTPAGKEEPAHMEIAVMVAMPNGQTKTLPLSSPPEYQIGLVTADFIERK